MTTELGVIIFRIAFWIYLAAAVCYIGYLIGRSDALGKVGVSLLILGLLANTGSLAVRMVAAGRPPFLNLYEYMLSFAWGAAVVYLALERMTKNRSLGSFVVPLIALFALLACRIPSEVNPTMPALKSAWRIPHIASGILAYAAFGIAFGISIMYLIRDRAERKGKSFWTTRLPSLEAIDRITYRTVAFGFMLQTLLLITGAIWAQYAWGRYWGWDPKETWGLVTWLIYAAYLHTRAIGWRGRKSAVVAIVGFIATIFTLLGVSFLMSGLHSYM